jgi:hypothetical protein
VGDDVLEGGSGDDLLDGKGGNDILRGGPGNDMLSDGDGIDQLFGEADDDDLDGGKGDDHLEGGDGDDDLQGDEGNDMLIGGPGHDHLDGGPGHDVLQGNAGDDSLEGKGGNDVLQGGSGNDSVSGGDNDDQLAGGVGNDSLHGGAGIDTCVGGETLTLCETDGPGDAVPPILTMTAPSGEVVNNLTPAIVMQYADADTGVDPTTLRVLVDTLDITSTCLVTMTSATCEPPALGSGPHTASAELHDLAGSLATASTTFTTILSPGQHTATLHAIADTSLQSDNMHTNQGEEAVLRLGDNSQHRVLVRFDPAQLTAVIGAGTLHAASLELFIEQNRDTWASSGSTVAVHRLTQAWEEVAATWECANDIDVSNTLPDCTVPWQGGNFLTNATDTALHTNDLTGWSVFDVTNDVTAFLAGTAHHGWLVKKTDETHSGQVQYTSREGERSQQPRLVLVFATSQGQTTPPTLSITAPNVLVTNGQPGLSVTYADADDDLDLTTLRMLLDGRDLTPFCFVGAMAARCDEVFFAEGLHTVEVRLSDAAGHLATASRQVLVDTTPPRITIDAAADAVTTSASITITGLIDDSRVDTVASGSVQVTVNGMRAQVTTGRFVAEAVPLLPGRNTITVVAVDGAGNTATTTSTVMFRDPNAAITLDIQSPAEGTQLAGSEVTVHGTVTNATGHETGVTINGVAALVHGEQFVASQVPLQEGENILSVLATDSAGNTASTFVTLYSEATEVSLRLTADTSSGLAPFETTLRLEGNASITASTLTVTGPGNAEVVPGLDATTYLVHLTTTGLYIVNAAASDEEGNQYTHSLALLVMDGPGGAG